VEADYLYATSLRVDPFRIGRLRLVALPILPAGDDRVAVLQQDEILARGDVGMATWLARAEAGFEAGLQRADRRRRGTVVDYLNTQNKLSYQRPHAARIVWGKGGTYIRSAVIPTDINEVHDLPVRGFVVDLNQYVITCNSDVEAHYLCAMLNSEPVDQAITADQTRGQFGPRDIHRRPVELVPIPRFEPNDEDHLRLAALSRLAHGAAETIPFDSQHHREAYIEMLGSSAEGFHEIAERLLAAPPSA
jgi:hypothetical protein